MRAALAVAAAAALIGAAWWATREQLEQLEHDDQADDPLDLTPDWQDHVTRTIATARTTLLGGPVADMQLSPTGLKHLRDLEGLSLTRYRLGDGGWTIGYGRYYPDGGPVPPERITIDQAEAWLREDAEDRGARWVRAYVTRPVTQSEFDALVSMAYNLSPRAFRTIAAAVNVFEDPEHAAMKFIRAGSPLERGLRRRRALELALFRSDLDRHLA